jgi:hypothetical protein
MLRARVHRSRSCAPGIAQVSEFDVLVPSVEDDPDDPEQSMGNRPDGLVMPQSRDPPLVQRLEKALRDV